MKRFLPLTFCCFLLGGCYENFDNSTVTNHQEEEQNFMDTKITGSLVGLDGNTITDYTLLINGERTEVNSQYFLTTLEGIRAYGQEIGIEKNGRLIGMAVVPLVEGSLNKLTLHVWPDPKTSTHEAHVSQEIALDNNTILSIPGEALEKEGEQFTGSYTATTNVLKEEKTIRNFGSRGFDQLGHPLALTIEKVWDVSTTTTAGEILTISENANVTMALSGNTLTSSTALFFYNDITNRWKWHSEITAANSSHIITQVGMYAVAQYYDGVNLEGNLSKGSTPVAYQNMNFVSGDYQHKSTTTIEGRWIAMVPKSTSYQIELINPCNEKVSSISKTSTKENQKDISLNATEGIYYNLGTQVFNCQKEIVDQASVTITQNALEHVIISDQNKIDSWVSICQESFSLSAYDINYGTSGPGIEWMASADDQADYLPLCDQFPNGYSFIKIRDEIEIFEPFGFSFNGQKTRLTSTSGNVQIQIEGGSSGIYSQEDFVILMDDSDFGSEGYAISCQSAIGCGIDDCIISHYDTDNGWIRVSFSGEIWMQTINPPKAGYFPVEGVILCKTN